MTLKKEILKNLSAVPDSMKFEDGISALKTAGIWPKEPKPAENGDNSALYLQFFLKHYSPRNIRSAFSNNPLNLKHPPSPHGSVWVILKTVEKADELIKSKLTAMGVVGDITVTSSQNIKKQLIEKSDTIIVSAYVDEEITNSLQRQVELIPGKKILHFVPNADRRAYSKKLAIAMRKTFVFSNESEESISVKIADTSMPIDAVKDNFLCVMNQMNIEERFQGGWGSLQKVGLKTGSLLVPIFEDNDSKMEKMGKKSKRKLFESDGSTEPAAKKTKAERFEAIKAHQERAFISGLKRSLVDKDEPNGQDWTPRKAKKNKQGKAPDKSVNNAVSPKIKPVLENGASPKDGDASAPEERKGRREQPKKEAELTSNDELVNMLINRAKKSVFCNEESKKNKKNKKNKGSPKVHIPVQKDGELSIEFKQKMMASLQRFTRGTELEDILAVPEEKPILKGIKEETAKVEVRVNGTDDVTKPKKKKSRKSKSPKKGNLVTPLASGQSPQATSGNNTPSKKNKRKSRKSKSPGKGKATAGSPQVNGNAQKKAQVTKVVKLESAGSKLKKKKMKKSMSPLQRMVAAV